MLKKIYRPIWKYMKSCDMFKVSYKREDTLEYWKYIEGIDRPVIKKRR